MKIKVFLVSGARPNFMKIAPVYEQMRRHPESFEPVIVHTGQHYDKNMSQIFFDDLELPSPDIYLDVGSGTHAQQTAVVMKRFEPHLLQQKPGLVLVVGDVNSTLACALTAIKSRIPSPQLTEFRRRYEKVCASRPGRTKPNTKTRSQAAPLIAHVEAGERSFDFSMPEEINRVETDILSDVLFTTCSDSDANLLREGVDPRTIFQVGNVMIDSLQKFLKKAGQSNILKSLNTSLPGHFPTIKPGQYALVTLHRPGNVDDPNRLKTILSALKKVSEKIPVIFPMHPRTRKVMMSLDNGFLNQVSQSPILFCEPFGYLDFLHLQMNARLVLTDSGGVQVETSYLGIPCLTLRPNTEWMITIREGTNRLVAVEENAILTAVDNALGPDSRKEAKIPNWDGKTAERIVDLFIDMVQ